MNETDQRRDGAGDGELGGDRQVLGAADPWASRSGRRDRAPTPPQRTSSWTIELVEVVRLDLDDAGLVDGHASGLVVPAS